MGHRGTTGPSDVTLQAFSIELDHGVGGETCLVVRGDLDIATSPQLEAQAEHVDAVVSTLVVDLEDVTFMDSTGLRALWTIRQRLTSTGATMLLRSPSDPVQRVLKTTKLDKVFDYAPGATD